MYKKLLRVVAVVLLLVLSFSTVAYAGADNGSKEENLRYSYVKSARAGLGISGGIATVEVVIAPKNGVSFASAVMTIELVKSSSGTTIQSWSGTYYPDSAGSIAFGDTQALYATGGYYVRVSGTVYTTSGAHEPFNATSGTATY